MYQPAYALTFDSPLQAAASYSEPAQVIRVSTANSYGYSDYTTGRNRDELRKGLLAAAKPARKASRFGKPIRPKADPLADSPRPVGWHYAGWLR